MIEFALTHEQLSLASARSVVAIRAQWLMHTNNPSDEFCMQNMCHLYETPLMSSGQTVTAGSAQCVIISNPLERLRATDQQQHLGSEAAAAWCQNTFAWLYTNDLQNFEVVVSQYLNCCL